MWPSVSRSSAPRADHKEQCLAVFKPPREALKTRWAICTIGMGRANARDMRLFATTSLTIFALLSDSAAAQQNEANRMKQSADQGFVTKAAEGGKAEVELGTLATQRASNEQVKQFGQRMIDDHSKANDELKSIVAGKAMSVPNAMDAKSRAVKTRLSKLTGAAFDRAYMEDMVKDHQEDIAEFQREADHGADPDIKAFAQKTLPTLQHHLQMAQDTLNAVKGGR